MWIRSQHGNRGAGEVKVSPSATSPAPIEVPELIEAEPACARVQLLRATDLFNRYQAFGQLAESVGMADLVQIRDGIREIAGAYQRWLRPIDEAQLLETLADFADMLDVKAPSSGGVTLYLEAMHDFPARLMPRARATVARTHRFARLPLPQDFLRAIAGELAWITHRKSWLAFIEQRFETAINQRSAREGMSQ